MNRSRYFLAALAGLWIAHPLPGQEPARLNLDPAAPPLMSPSVNQVIADAIAARLGQCTLIHDYTIDISYQNGVAELTGTVADPQQRDLVLRLVQGAPGVERIRNLLKVNAAEAIVPVQALAAVQERAPMPSKVDNGSDQPMVEPVPYSQYPAASPYDLNQPRMPPYAWPTYAPYNNYSRVAYPTAYPAQSFPFIGPAYPFPKVPLGWRSVKLEWQDGHWWFSKLATNHDLWRLRYW
jgi:hypothetical protein